MEKVTQKTTADTLMAMPDDGYRYELVRGELKKMTPAGERHGAVIWELSGLLFRHIKEFKLGQGFGAETGFQIFQDPDTVRAPDIAFIRSERLSVEGLQNDFSRVVPDLIVEVMSPRDTVYDLEEKVTDWILAGVAMVWIVNPKQRTVHVHRPGKPAETLGERDVLSGQEVVPGFQCGVAEIFPLS